MALGVLFPRFSGSVLRHARLPFEGTKAWPHRSNHTKIHEQRLETATSLRAPPLSLRRLCALCDRRQQPLDLGTGILHARARLQHSNARHRCGTHVANLRHSRDTARWFSVRSTTTLWTRRPHAVGRDFSPARGSVLDHFVIFEQRAVAVGGPGDPSRLFVDVDRTRDGGRARTDWSTPARSGYRRVSVSRP